MGLTPDEIAHRAFTPSVDGYHQGEVRSFLERIAAQLRGLQSAMPEGRAELAELTAALQDGAPRMAGLQDQLHDMLAELTAATSLMKEAQSEAASQLSVAQQITADHAVAATAAAGGDIPGTSLVAELAAQLALATKLTAEQREAAEHLATAGEQQANQLELANKLTTEQRDAAAALTSASEAVASAGASPSADAPTAAAPVERSGLIPRAYTDPVDAPKRDIPTTGADPTSSSASAMSLFPSDLDEPLFSDNANDLLDGVLDDVMGNLNEEGDPS